MVAWLRGWRTWPKWVHVAIMLGGVLGIGLLAVGAESRQWWVLLPGAVLTLATGSVMVYVTLSNEERNDISHED